MNRMDWDTQYNLCNRIAIRVHAGQLRRDKVTPYITHPQTVSALLTEYGVLGKCIAVLHDVIEDDETKETTIVSLIAEGVHPTVAKGVGVLSRRPGEQYFSYIGRIIDNDLSGMYCHIKMADIVHNLSCGHTMFGETKRYFKALTMLSKWR